MTESTLHLKSLNSEKNKSAETSLKVQELSFSYGDFSVFKNISFELKKGTLVALTGPSGCGKSTLFECLAGLKKNQGGKIYALSRPVLGLQESEAALFEPYSADDVAFGPKNKNIKGKELFERVKKSMELAGLDYKKYGNLPIVSLSGGEKRKLSVAGLIALDSDILIFDEPTAGLDPVSRKNLLASFRKLAESGKTVLFSTHRFQEAEAADFRLRWEDLISKREENSDSVLGNLREMNLIENALMLEKNFPKRLQFFSSPEKNSSFVYKFAFCRQEKHFFISYFCVFCFHFTSVPGLHCDDFFVNILYSILAKSPLKNAFKIIARLVPWIVIFSLLGIILFPVYEGDRILFSWKMIFVTPRKLLLFAASFVHSVCAIFAIGTYIFTADERQVMDGISAILKPLTFFKFPVRSVVLIVGIIFLDLYRCF
ncbi:MAG: ATP-binding cassette domain-containing protein [Treponema succinifaciens]|nr:MAG: ATP-binding cassette domain-containing protein [Treponema succinifaciens]